jgi:hypothetical protein
VQGTRATVLDTRKTAPGLRLLDKWAVRIGGGQNHRIGARLGVLGVLGARAGTHVSLVLRPCVRACKNVFSHLPPVQHHYLWLAAGTGMLCPVLPPWLKSRPLRHGDDQR